MNALGVTLELATLGPRRVLRVQSPRPVTPDGASERVDAQFEPAGPDHWRLVRVTEELILWTRGTGAPWQVTSWTLAWAEGQLTRSQALQVPPPLERPPPEVETLPFDPRAALVLARDEAAWQPFWASILAVTGLGRRLPPRAVGAPWLEPPYRF